MHRYCCQSVKSPQRACHCCLRLVTPALGQTLGCLPYIEGIACPNETVTITIDDALVLQATADRCGVFRVENPHPLSNGAHCLCARACPSNCCACHTFCIQNTCPPPPSIDTPACGSVIADPSPWITGRGTPGDTVRVCIQGYGCRMAAVDQSGEYRVNFGVSLPDGAYALSVTQLAPGGGESQTITCTFTVKTSQFLVEPIDARMGATFRTVDVDVRIKGGSGPARVYYLLLPPGSPVPAVAEIINYTNTAALLDGTSATGQFDISLNPSQTLYTWALTGLDNPSAPVGATGVIDGYRYDVYLYIVFASANSGALTFEEAAMGMPFASGRGTAENPFTIRELSPDELLMYPDLLADNPLNQPGVDENARMLENIERLVTLYERTNGYYGLADSMAFHYRMTSDMDLAAYAAAYDGAGWEPIGDIDGWINDRKETEHLFSGVFDGSGHIITNLSITPTATDDYFVGYRGLFGGVEFGAIRDLTLSGVTIDAFATPPGQAQFGSFISIARGPVLSGLTLLNANLTADIGEVAIGDTHAVNMGGFVAEMFEGGTVSNITGQNIAITVPARSALALGGFVGFTDKFDAYESYEDVFLSNVSISGDALIGGLAGYMVYGVNHIDNAMVNHIAITAPGGESGGLIGRLYIYSGTGDCLIENSRVQDVAISINGTGDPGGQVGGLIGRIQQNPFSTFIPPPDRRIFAIRESTLAPMAIWPATTVRQCSVLGGQLTCANDGGGLIGYAFIGQLEAAGRTSVTLCKTNISVLAIADNAGGLIGFSQDVLVDQSFALGNVMAVTNCPGGLIGFLADGAVTNSYSTGACSGGSVGGGCIGNAVSSVGAACYSIGNVSAMEYTGGIAGASQDSSLQGNLVLGGTITAATAHRILGVDNGATALQSNYALDTVTPAPGSSNPNGLDGGTIGSADIISTIQSLGWNTATIWNIATVNALDRPTLLQNPE